MREHVKRSASPPRVTFLGATKCVTGSMHLVEFGPYRFLLDCGLTRGPRDESRLRNRHFPFPPSFIDAVILSHAHVDHCGNLPNLVGQGFAGPIYCTPATRDLMAVMLTDSARIQEDEARIAAALAGGGRGGPVPVERRPLYTRQDAELTVERCIVADYDKPLQINADAQVRFIEAGHILGSGIVHLTLLHGGHEFRITFTGDLGRRGLPFLPDPSAVPEADLLISESTYGGRTHDTVGGMGQKMSDIVRRTVARGGKVFIPAFSLGRTQIVLHYLREWTAAGLLPQLPIYVDSPLAAEISMVYDEYPAAFLTHANNGVPIEYMLSREEARSRSIQRDPCIIVASGGMCEGGRIVDHLKHHIDDPRSAVVLVSYQSPESLGAQMLQPRPTVRFHGRTWNKWIEVAEINGFSGHADQNDFRELLGGAVGRTRKIRLVHGEPEQAEAMATTLRGMGFSDVGVPEREEVVEVA